jgi:UDP-2,3-diacylglucosamine pyrophosphatase LpxH
MSISDVHWLSKYTRAKRLCMMLDNIEADEMAGIGDMVDGIAMMKKRTFNAGPYHRQGMARLLRKAANGTIVNIIDGNHEGDLGEMLGNGKHIYGVNFATRGEHIDPQGRRILLIHGDDWDREVFKTPEQQEFWYSVGDAALSLGYNIDSVMQNIPVLEKFSVAAGSKRLVKGFINKKMGVNDAIARDIDAGEFDGVLYGHSHMKGFMRTPGGKIMINDGCCTEHVQFAVHDKLGNWAVIEYHKDRMDIEMENGENYSVRWKDLGLSHFADPPKIIEDEFTAKTDRLLRIAYRLWPAQDQIKRREEFELRERQVDILGKLLESKQEIPDHLRWAFLNASAELPELRKKLYQVPIPRNYVERQDEPLLAIA